MAHELEMIDGEASMAYAGEVPWHGLGTRVSDDLTPYQMLKAAKLDWKVEKQPVYTSLPNKSGGVDVIDIPGKSALVRTKDQEVFDIVSDGWEPIQTIEQFSFFKDFVRAGKMKMHTAGSLFGGRKVWALAEINDGFSLFNGKDRIQQYFLFTNFFEYGKSTDLRTTDIRAVCNNTVSAALLGKADKMMRLHHRKKFDAEHVKKVLGMASIEKKAFQQIAELLSVKKFTNETLKDYVSQVFPKTTEEKEGEEGKLSRPAKLVLSVMDTQPGAEFGKGSWWQAYNAVTFATDHLLGHGQETRLNSNWYGSNFNRKEKAKELAVEFAKAA